MDSEDSLAISGKKHQISFPMTRSLTGFNLRGALANRDAILDGFHGKSRLYVLSSLAYFWPEADNDANDSLLCVQSGRK